MIFYIDQLIIQILDEQNSKAIQIVVKVRLYRFQPVNSDRHMVAKIWERVWLLQTTDKIAPYKHELSIKME